MVRILPHHPCPPFSTQDVLGRSVTLGTLSGHHLLISFLPDLRLPVAARRLAELSARHERWRQQKLTIVSVLRPGQQWEAERLGRYPFHVVVDHDMTLHRAFRAPCPVLQNWIARSACGGLATLAVGAVKRLAAGRAQRLLPADFLVYQDGTLARAHYGDQHDDHMPVPHIDEWITYFAC